MSDENTLTDESVIETPVTEESAPEAEIQDGGDAEQETETREERPSRAKDRIRELVADKRAAVEYAELQRQRAQELETKLKGLETPREAVTRPKLADFETPEAWADAVTTWSEHRVASRATEIVDQRLREREKSTQKQSREADFKQRLDAAASKHADFDDVVFSDETYMPANVVEVLYDFDNAGELAYRLAKDPVTTRRIANLPPTRMAAELARMETQMSTPKPKPKPKVTEAPEPITPLGGGKARDVDLSKLSTADYIKARRAQLRAKQR